MYKSHFYQFCNDLASNVLLGFRVMVICLRPSIGQECLVIVECLVPDKFIFPPGVGWRQCCANMFPYSTYFKGVKSSATRGLPSIQGSNHLGNGDVDSRSSHDRSKELEQSQACILAVLSLPRVHRQGNRKMKAGYSQLNVYLMRNYYRKQSGWIKIFFVEPRVFLDLC